MALVIILNSPFITMSYSSSFLMSLPNDLSWVHFNSSDTFLIILNFKKESVIVLSTTSQKAPCTICKYTHLFCFLQPPRKAVSVNVKQKFCCTVSSKQWYLLALYLSKRDHSIDCSQVKGYLPPRKFVNSNTRNRSYRQLSNTNLF